MRAIIPTLVLIIIIGHAEPTEMISRPVIMINEMRVRHTMPTHKNQHSDYKKRDQGKGLTLQTCVQ